MRRLTQICVIDQCVSFAPFVTPYADEDRRPSVPTSDAVTTGAILVTGKSERCTNVFTAIQSSRWVEMAVQLGHDFQGRSGWPKKSRQAQWRVSPDRAADAVWAAPQGSGGVAIASVRPALPCIDKSYTSD